MSSAEKVGEAFVLGRAVDLGLESAGNDSQTGANIGEILDQFGEEERIDPAMATMLEAADTEAIHAKVSDGRRGYDYTEEKIIDAIWHRNLATTTECRVADARAFDSDDAERSFVGLVFDSKGLQAMRSARGTLLSHFKIDGRQMNRDPFIRVAMAESGYARYVAESISGLLKEPLKIALSPEYYIEESEEINP